MKEPREDLIPHGVFWGVSINAINEDNVSFWRNGFLI